MQAQAAVDLAFFSFLYILSAARVRPLLLSLTFAERRNPIIHGLISPTFAQISAAVRSSPETNNGGGCAA